MAGSVAGLVGGSCPACKGSGKAQPGRPVEDPVGGGVPNEPNFGGAIDATHLPSTNKGAQPRRIGAGDSKRSAAAPGAPNDKDVRKPSAAGQGDDIQSKSVAKDATNSVSPGKVDGEAGAEASDVWEPKSTWEHGWGSESEPDNSNSGDDGDKPNDLEEEA